MNQFELVRMKHNIRKDDNHSVLDVSPIQDLCNLELLYGKRVNLQIRQVTGALSPYRR